MARRSKRKRPSLAGNPTQGKNPNFKEAPPDGGTLSFYLGHFDAYPEWSVIPKGVTTDSKDKDHFADVCRSLRDLTGLGLKMLHGQGQVLHSVPISQLCPEAQKRVTSLKHDDVARLDRLRLSGRWRVWGILQPDGLFRVLWWDPYHRICPSPKKHT